MLIPSTSTDQLSGYESKWNDLSELRAELKNKEYTTKCIVSTPLLVENLAPSKTLFVALGVEKPYTDQESQAIYEFLQAGGKAIIADDSNNADSLARKFGLTFYGMRLYSKNFNLTAEFVQAVAKLGGAEYNILLNIPTGLMIENYSNVEVISKLSQCYLDWDRNQLIDANDTFLEDVALIAKIKVGYGEVVFISDSSIFINELFRKAENSEFILALVTRLLPEPKGSTVVFDETRHEAYPALGTLVFLTSYQLAILLASLALGVALAIAIIKSKGKEPWRHEFSLHEFSELPLENLYERAGKAVLEKIKIAYNISQIERLTDRQLDSIDPALTKLVRGKRCSREELRALIRKLGSR